MADAGDSPPSPSEGTEENKSADHDKVPGAARRKSVLPTILFWVVALGFSSAVAFSNHWLADMALALLPIVLIAAFIVFGIVQWLRRR